MASSHRDVRPAYPNAPRGSCRGCGKPGATERGHWHRTCLDRHRERVDYRGAAAKREGQFQRCVDCKRVTGEWATDDKGRRVQIKVQRDHVVALSLFGRHDWTAGRCQLCHRDKSKRDNARAKTVREDRRARRTARTGGKTVSTSSRHKGGGTGGPRRGWTGDAARTIGGALILAAGIGWALRDRWLPPALTWWDAHRVQALALALMGLVALTALTSARWWLRRRRAHRDDAVYRLSFLIAKETRTDPNEIKVKVRRWAHEVPVAGQCWYSEVFDDDDPVERERIETKVAHKLGLRLAFRWTPAGDTFRWEPLPDGAAENMPADIPADPDEADRHAKVRERVEDKVRSLIKGEVRFEWGVADAVSPIGVQVEYPSTYNDESDDARQALVDAVNSKAPGRWRASWNTEQNVVRFERRPAMPSNVPTPTATDGDRWRLPFGVDEHADEVAWSLKQAPHALISGGTGSGKTVTLRAIVQAAVARGFVVFCVDPKRIEMAGLRGWPGVRVVATEITEMIALVHMVADEMDARYAAIEAGDVDEDHLAPVLLVIDEAREFIDRANAWWKANKQAGMTGTEHPVVERWRSMARLGRSGRIHLVVGIQRPDAKVFGGEARDNYGFRVSLGPISEQGARMMFGRTDVGRDIPTDAKGRATVGIGEDRSLEVQGYNTPDPRRKGLSSDDRALLDLLRDLATQHASDALPHITAEAVEARAQEMADDPAERQRAQAARPPSRPRRAEPSAPVKPKPEPEPWERVDPATLSEGERVRLHVDGVLTEVEVTAPPCEAPDDPEVVEIEWQTADGRAGVEAFNPGDVVDRRVSVASAR